MTDHAFLQTLGVTGTVAMAAAGRFGRGFDFKLGRAKIFIGGLGGWSERRARRGDVKYEILEVLADGPRHGYDIILAIEEERGQRPSAGSIYPTLQMLEDEGYVSSAQSGGKRVYAIAESGRGLLADRPENPGDDEDEHEQFAEGLGELKQAAIKLGAAVVQLAQNGSREARKDARKVLDDARREIYELLGGDED